MVSQLSRIAILVSVTLQSAAALPLVARSLFQPQQNGQFNQVDQSGNPVNQIGNNGQFFGNSGGQGGVVNGGQFGNNPFFGNGGGQGGNGGGQGGGNGGMCFDPAIAEPENDYGTTGLCGVVRNPWGGNGVQPGQDPDPNEHPGGNNGGSCVHNPAIPEPENDYGTTGECGVVRNPMGDNGVLPGENMDGSGMPDPGFQNAQFNNFNDNNNNFFNPFS